jgi:hypothetical protein
MSGFTDILGKIVTGVTGAMTGGGVVPAAIAIGKDLLELVNEAREVVSSDDLPALEAMAHADRTEADLRG